MKSIIIILLLISTNVFGQTNYNTIMNTQKDSIPPIDLHYQRSERYNTTATFLHLATIVSLTTLYYIAPTKPIGFMVPSGLCVTSIGFHFLSGREFKKSQNYLESE